MLKLKFLTYGALIVGLLGSHWFMYNQGKASVRLDAATAALLAKEKAQTGRERIAHEEQSLDDIAVFDRLRDLGIMRRAEDR